MPKGPKGQKRPADVIGNAVKVMHIATALIKASARSSILLDTVHISMLSAKHEGLSREPCQPMLNFKLRHYPPGGPS